MHSYDLPMYYASIVMSIIVLSTNIFYYILELQQRKSFTATLNKFNLLCTGCLFGIFGVFLIDISWYNIYLEPLSLQDLILYNFFSYLTVAVTECCYLFYVYYRSDAVLWGSRWRQVTRYTVYFVLFLSCYNLIASVLAFIVNHTSVVYYSNILVAFLVWALDVFYTIVFLRHVYNSRKIRIVNGQSSESDIVARFGLFCAVMSSLALYTFFASYMLDFSFPKSLMVFISRIFLTLCALGMILMKLALYRLKGKMVSTLKITGVKDNKISMSSQPLSQAETQAISAPNNIDQSQIETLVNAQTEPRFSQIDGGKNSKRENFDQAQIETLVNAQTESRFSHIDGGNHSRSKTRELEEGSQNVK